MKKHYDKHIKFFISKVGFDHLHYKLNVNPPNFDYDINIFYSILNDLSNIKYFNAYTSDNGFIPLSSVYLKQKYNNSYSKYIQYLNVNCIIYSSLFYSINNCYYYSIAINDSIINLLDNEYYNTSYCILNNDSNSSEIIDIKGFEGNIKMVKYLQFVCIKISIKSSVGKKIIESYNKELDKIKHSANHIKKMAYHFKDTVEIDVEKAKKHTLELYQADLAAANEDAELSLKAYHKCQYRLRSILALGEGKKGKLLRFSRNLTNKRIDTNLTNLSKDLRQFLNGYNGMSYLDLANSQPVLFNIILKNHYSNNNPKLKAEIDLYKQVTLNGGWYEFLMDIYHVNRDAAKEIWMKIAYSKNSSRIPEKKPFALKFPEITKLIKKLKEKNHAKFSIELQKIESSIFIDEICKALVDVGIIPYSLHDGLLVPKETETIVLHIMSTILAKHLGAIPVIALNDVKIRPQTII